MQSGLMHVAHCDNGPLGVGEDCRVGRQRSARQVCGDPIVTATKELKHWCAKVIQLYDGVPPTPKQPVGQCLAIAACVSPTWTRTPWATFGTPREPRMASQMTPNVRPVVLPIA